MNNSKLTSIFTDKAALPQGHYSQAIRHENTIYVATQLGISPNDPSCEVGTIEEQTEQIINNVEQILIAGNSGLDRVIRVTIYVSDIEFWPAINNVYSRRFGTHKPARGVIPCKTLHKGYQVAFDVIASV